MQLFSRDRRVFLPFWCLVLLPLAGLGVCRAAKPNLPVLTLPLSDLGYTPVQQHYLMNGDTMFTLHFVDDRHLLVTFDIRGLLTRLPDARSDDMDHNVMAVLIELPTGQVLAKTTWRLRDHGQYLFPLSHGRFLLRRRNELVVLSPLLHLPAGKAFEEEAFLQFRREISYISISPGGDLLAIETTRAQRARRPALNSPANVAALNAVAGGAAPPASRPGGAASGPAGTPSAAGNGSAGTGNVPSTAEPDLDPDETQPAGVEIHLVRMIEDDASARKKLVGISAGIVHSRALVEIPATSEGFLDALQESKNTWDFDFQIHDGKRMELSPFDTTCMPRARFVSRSEFIAFGCRDTEDHQEMAGFNFKGEETWINVFSNRHLFPYLVTSPDAGRFALSRTVINGTYVDPAALTPDEIAGQEVTFYQTYDGRPLLKVQTTPFQKAGQNFDISPDGLAAAIIHDASIQVYRLPDESRKDTQEVAAAHALVPPATMARVSLRSKAAEDAAKTATVNTKDPETSGTTSAAGGSLSDLNPGEGQPPAPQPTPAEKANTVGDVQGAPRKAPTLYTPDHPKDPR